MRAHGSPAAPVSPEAATTVTWWSASAWSAAFSRVSWALSTQCSPPIWPARAEGDDAALRGAQPQGGDRGRDRLPGAVQGGSLDQDDGERGAGSDRVDHFGVQNLLPKGEPGVHRAGEGAHHLQARRRQVVQAVVGGEVLAQVGNHGRVRLRLGEFRQHHGLAAAVDPAPEERLDAVGGLELLRRVTGRGRSLPLSWGAGWRTTTAWPCREPWRPRWSLFVPGRRPRRAALSLWPGRIRGLAAAGTARCLGGIRFERPPDGRLAMYYEYYT